MAYKIQYGQTMTKTNIPDKRRNSGKKIGSFLLCAAAAVIGVLILTKAEKLETYIYPGNTKVTKEALSAFAEDMRDGEDIKDAFLVFCREIIDNANVS